MAERLFAWVVETSAYTAVVIALVLAVQTILGSRLRARWRYALWALVAARALAPALPQSSWSVFNYTPEIVPARAEAASVADVLPPVIVRVKATSAVAGTIERPAAQSDKPIRPLPWIWLGGCAVFAALSIASALTFTRRLRRAQAVDDPRVLWILDECHRSLGLRAAPPPVLVVSGISGPALTGVAWPRIIVPPGLLEGLEDEELRFVLAHELCHLKRRDLLAEWLLLVVRTVHWFNPLVWYAVARCRADRELACDEQVMGRRASQSSCQSYGSTILKLAQGLPSRVPAFAAAPSVRILDGASQLKRRIRMIAGFNRAVASRWPALALFLACVVVLASCTLTDRTSAPKKPAPTPRASEKPDGFGRITRVYDTRDLIITIPDFVPPPTVFGDNPDQAQIDKLPTRDEAILRLITLVKETASPDTWGKPGGSELRELQAQFVVTAAPEIHEQVRALLQQLREARNVQIQVETRFIAVDDDTLAAMKNELAELFEGDVTPPAAADKLAAGPTVFVSDEQLKALLKAARDVKTAALTAPRITLFNGQRAYVLVQTQRAYVKSLTIVKDKDGKTSYEPEIDTVSTGVALDVQATTTPDRKSVIATLRPALSNLVAVRDVRFPNAPPGEELWVQQPDVQTSQLRTVVTIPDGKTVLLRGLRGSMTLDGDQDEAPAPIRNVLMLVKPTVIISRESDPPRAEK